MFKKILIVLFLTGSLYSAIGDAGQEIALVEIGYGAKAFSLGSAYVAHQPDATSLYWNPAGLGYIKKSEIATMQNKLSTDASYYYLGGVFPALPLNLGFSWVQLELADIPQTAATLNNNQVTVLNNLTYYASALTIGGGQKITEQLAVGFNAKYITKKLSDDQGQSEGYSYALGLLYTITDKVRFGLLADNLNNYQKYNTGTFETVPIKYTAGFCFGLNEKLNLLLDVEKRADPESFSKGHGGLEYIFNENVQFALGYDYDRLTAGAGFQVQSIYVDYAYCANNPQNLGIEHFVTLGVRW